VASIDERETTRGKRYDVRWRDYGNPKERSRTVHTLEAARRLVREVERAHDERRPYVDEAPPPVVLTLAACGNAYLLDCKRTASAKGLAILELSISTFIGWLGNEEGCTPEPRHLTRARLAEFHAWLQTDRAVTQRLVDGRTNVRTYRCSVGTANARVRAVEAWWRWLVESGDYPDGAIPMPKRIKLASPPAPPRNVAPTWAEMDAAIEAAPPAWSRLITVMRCTGLRTTQAMRLLRTDVDLGAGTLTVRGVLGKSRQERAGRTVPVTPQLIAAIREWPLCPDGYLIRWDTPSHHGKPKRQVDHGTARRILARAGVRPAVWATKEDEEGNRRNGHPLHCLRAGYITGLRGAGVSEDTTKLLVGHSGTVTTDRYTDEVVFELRAAVEKVPPIVRPRLATVTTIGRAVNRRYSPDETEARLVQLLPPEWREGNGVRRGAWTWLAERIGVPRGSISAALHTGGTVTQVDEWAAKARGD
jgi:integrase